MVVALARLALPTAPPLYDGVVPTEPYVWLDPPSGAPGGALGTTAAITVHEGRSPLIAVVTPEVVPQAQLFAEPGVLHLPPGTRTIEVSIQPVPAEGAPSSGHVDGNVYRITVTDQDSAPLVPPSSASVTVVLRGTDPSVVDATIERYSDGSWQPQHTESAGFGGTFIAVVTTFGDFAVVAPGPGPSRAVSAADTTTARPAASGPSGSPGAARSAESSASGSSTPAPPGPPAWLLPVIGAGIAGVVIAGYLIAGPRRRRQARHRGAHRVRRR